MSKAISLTESLFIQVLAATELRSHELIGQ